MRVLSALGAISLVCLAACSNAASETEEGSTSEDKITSTDGTPLEFRFESEVVARKDALLKNAAIAQLEYLQGMLTTQSRANAQFRFSDVKASGEPADEGADKKRFKYTAVVSVIFPEAETLPTSYDVALPLDVTDLQAFNRKYDNRCGKNEYGTETFWHDWNPKYEGCTLDDDVIQTRATVRKHPQGTTDKFPEYDKVWADGSLDIVAVYGAISNTTDNDSGARDREGLLTKVKSALTGGAREDLTPARGILKHSVVTGKVQVGGATKKVRLVAYFVREAKSAGTEFMTSYTAETAKADIIVYSGHSGLGENIKALADNMGATAGHYQIAFFNGCQTWGYLGPNMHEKRRDLNGGAARDPNGTKFLDTIVTTLPAYAEPLPTEQILFDAMLKQEKGWQDLLKDFSGQQWNKHLTTVFGEDDNTFRP